MDLFGCVVVCLLHDIQGETMLQLHACGGDNCSQRSGSPALLPDNLPYVALSYFEAENGPVRTWNRFDKDLCREINE